MKLKAFLLNSELGSLAILRRMIHGVSEKVKIVGESALVADATLQIKKLQPDVVFLDVDLAGQKSFELFDYFPNPAFSIIIASAQSCYAAEAFRLAAGDYILKPFQLKQLQEALWRVWEKSNCSLTRRS